MKEYNIRDSLKRLFLSRHFLIFAAGVVFFSIKYLTGDQFCLLMLYVMGTSSIDKFKDSVKIGGSQ